MMNLTKKDKIQAVIVFGMIIIFIFLAKDAFSRIKKTQERRRRQKEIKERLAPKASAVTSPLAAASIQPAAAVAQKHVSSRSGGIDPFFGKTVNIAATHSSAKSLRLTGIAYNIKDPKNSYAIINNEVFKVGETVLQAVVADIKEDEVTLLSGSQETKLKVW